MVDLSIAMLVHQRVTIIHHYENPLYLYFLIIINHYWTLLTIITVTILFTIIHQ